MAAKKTKKRGGTKPGSKGTGVAKTPEEMQKARNKVVNLVVNQSEEMAARVARLVSEHGNLPALKFLWEIAGMFPVPNADDEEDSGISPLEKLGLCGDRSEDEEDLDADVESRESRPEP
jgi:hypothetical protein